MQTQAKHHPISDGVLLWYGHSDGGFESRLLATCRWHVATGVAFPQKSKSTFPHQNPNAKAFGFLLFTYYLFTLTLNRIRVFGKVISKK